MCDFATLKSVLQIDEISRRIGRNEMLADGGSELMKLKNNVKT